jgi:ribonuclease D
VLPVFPEIKVIDNKLLPEYPVKSFEGEVIVVDSIDKISEATNYLATQTILGFDTETKPSFKKGINHGVSLLQLSSSEKAYIFQLKKVGIDVHLAKILANPKIIKAGVAIRDDIKILRRIRGFDPKGFVELQDYVKEFGIENFGLKKLSALVLGYKISKSQQLSNWESDTLTHAQQIYAATDAWVSLQIYLRLIELANQS